MSELEEPHAAGGRRARRRWPWLVCGVVLGAVAAVLVAGAMQPQRGAPESSGSGVAHSGEHAGENDRATTPPADQSAHVDEGGHDHQHGMSPSGWREAADGFGRTFTHTALGQESWFAAVSAWMTPQQAAAYEQVPVASIPPGELVDVQAGNPGGALFAIAVLTYDTGMELQLGLTYDADTTGWLVASVRPLK